MKGRLIAEATVTIDTPADKVWKAITTPELISKYLFGTKVESDWKEGSAIAYSGVHQGNEYHDKGTIIKLEPNQIFASTYWSSMGGKEDKPENYNLVTYFLHKNDSTTTVTLVQDNVLTEEEQQHAESNWEGVLKELKKVVEKL